MTACLAGFSSYLVCRKQCKEDINKLDSQYKLDLQKLEKQFELDIEKEREKFQMEKEKMQLAHQYQLELKDKDIQNQIGANLINSVTKEYMKSPEVKQQLFQGHKQKKKK